MIVIWIDLRFYTKQSAENQSFEVLDPKVFFDKQQSSSTITKKTTTTTFFLFKIKSTKTIQVDVFVIFLLNFLQSLI